MKVEALYEETRKMLQARPAKVKIQAYCIDAVIAYESTKAAGGILLSSKILERLNERLTADWERIKAGIN